LALRRKRDQISGTIAHYERLLREAEHDLAHINAGLRLFEATGEAADLPPYVDLNRVMRRGETTKICMDALAKEGPLDTRQLALRVIRSKGLSESDKVLAQTVALRVVQTLRMRARQGRKRDKDKGRLCMAVTTPNTSDCPDGRIWDAET
jgi:hypothetical protein